MSQLLVDHSFLTEINHQQGNRGCEENVDGRTHRKAGTHSQSPQNDQYDGYRPQHVNLLSEKPFPLPVAASCQPAVGSYTSGYGITMPAGSDHTLKNPLFCEMMVIMACNSK